MTSDVLSLLSYEDDKYMSTTSQIYSVTQFKA
jgi:hypothetical protein